MKTSMQSPSLHRRWARFSLLASACFAATLSQAQTIPTDAKSPCTVPASMFASWFESGMPSENGVVNPANSITFTPVAVGGDFNCSFFQWSEQMFLWATSPAPKSYGGNGRVFDSPVFFDVSPPDANNVRTLIPNTGTGFVHALGVRVAQKGPHGLPVIFDKSGKMLDLVKPQTKASNKLMLRLPDGKQIEPGEVKIDKAGKVQFQDKEGKALDGAKLKSAKPFVLDAAGKTVDIKKIIVGRNGLPIFLNTLGQAVDVEQGQAGGGGVLMSQGQSLVYYATQVNDVYAYFLTGAKDGTITPAPTTFPTTQAALNQVIAVAKAAPPPYTKQSFPDGIALAIELKSAWVEASTLPNNAAGYITMMATIPTYTKNSANSVWTLGTATKQALLAMVGIHVVGSAKNHPEMIWASFEHFGNTPNAAYTYNSTSGTKTVPQSTAGNWTFTQSGVTCVVTGSNPTCDVEYMNYQSPFDPPNPPTASGIVAAAKGTSTPPIPPGTVSPSNTLRENPWGTPGTPATPTNNQLNSDVIAMNKAVIGQLVGADIRKNYFMIGSTWTKDGTDNQSSAVGTNLLANTTMETYQQAANCFDCHTGNMLSGLSHIYGTATTGIKPLF